MAAGKRESSVVPRGGGSTRWPRIGSVRLRRALGLGLVLLNAVLINVIAARHAYRADWTSTQLFALSQRTKQVLDEINRPVDITVFMTPPDRFAASPYRPLRELLERFQQWSRRIRVEIVDLDTNPTRATLIAREKNVPRRELREGVVVVSSGSRTVTIPSRALAQIEVAAGGQQRLVAFDGEAALLVALQRVLSAAKQTVCFTTDHGEAPTDSYAESGYGYIVDEVRRDGYETRAVNSEQLIAGVKGCDVLVIGGPTRAFAPVELEAIDHYLEHGGRLFVLVGPQLDRQVTRYGRIALDSWLAGWGAELPLDIVVDPVSVAGEQPLLTWATRSGYGQHPIGRAMDGRLTVWPLTRAVLPRPQARAGLEVESLVHTSDRGWGETDLASLRGETALRLDQGVDVAGPVSVAIAAKWRKARMVVWGTERGVINQRLAGNVLRDDNRDLFLASVAWLAGTRHGVAVGPKVPQRYHLAVEAEQLGRVLVLTVVGLPAFALFGALLVWWRRRR